MSIEWLVTSPNPRFNNAGWDGGKRGWKLHAVVDPKFDLPPSVWTPKDGNRSRTRALCGLVPRHGWGMDLFIEDECERCAAIAERLSAATTQPEDAE